jgi:hypothetical protein
MRRKLAKFVPAVYGFHIGQGAIANDAFVCPEIAEVLP